jgi:hypothetical protein
LRAIQPAIVYENGSFAATHNLPYLVPPQIAIELATPSRMRNPLARSTEIERRVRGYADTALTGYFPLDPCFCDSALPAADLDALLVRPSRSVFEAAEAALDDVVLLGAFDWESALPAALFDALPVAWFVSVLDALDAALPLVVLLCAMAGLPGRLVIFNAPEQ